MKIVMLGAPGAGKGTHAVGLSKKYNIPHISTGNIFRENIRNHTELGIKARQHIDRGELVPDDITIGMLASRLSESDCKNGFILDGFPRTIAQAEALKEILTEEKSGIDYVININVSDDTVMARIGGRLSCPACGAVYHKTSNPPKIAGKCDRCKADLIVRDDDRPETVKNRLKTYYLQTAPLTLFYQNEGILKNIDGNKEQKEVFDEIIREIS